MHAFGPELNLSNKSQFPKQDCFRLIEINPRKMKTVPGKSSRKG